MLLHHLHLTQYRNFTEADIDFSHKVNLLVGENAQGKTNLLEAIFVLALAKSHRTPKDKQLIHWNEEYARIEGEVENKHGRFPLDVLISGKGKKVKANHLEQQKLSAYIGKLNVVMFAPEDLNLIKGGPQVRRRFINMEMGQVYPLYIYELGQYQKLLQQRNALLKNPAPSEAMLDILTDQLIEYAVPIIQKRRQFITLLEKWAVPIHGEISRGAESLAITYQSSAKVSEEEELSKIIEEFKQQFTALRRREIERGVTLLGPHRDDIALLVNKRNVQTYGSQGQQRTAALSLKLAEIELIAAEVGEYPLLLLDDVLSELDHERQSHLLDAIRGKVQTFVTTTHTGGIHHQTMADAVRYQIASGTVTETR